MATAHSLAFNLDGTKLYSGFNRMIRVFDVSRPGRECIHRPTFGKPLNIDLHLLNLKILSQPLSQYQNSCKLSGYVH